MATIGVQKEINKAMQAFLRPYFPRVVVKYMEKGSLRGSYRLYSRPRGGEFADYDKWTPEVYERLNSLGFRNLWGSPLDRFDGNGGLFSVNVRKPKSLMV